MASLLKKMVMHGIRDLHALTFTITKKYQQTSHFKWTQKLNYVKKIKTHVSNWLSFCRLLHNGNDGNVAMSLKIALAMLVF